MSKYIYLTSNPEALVASMLPPDVFGHYLSTGTKKRNKGQVIFFEVELDKIATLINWESLNKRCVAKPDGSPKSSVYISVYKVLELIPLAALKNLYVTTENGITLELKRAPYDKKRDEINTRHLYQELCPVSPLVASSLGPADFLKKLTDGSIPILLPKLFFVELKLGELAADPVAGSSENLPYENIGHLRDCLEIIKGEYDKKMKTVNRLFSGELLYRNIESGFYVGNSYEIIYYPFPKMDELEKLNHDFFRTI